MKTSFDLSHNKAVGFSVTKDMRLLDPLGLSQNKPQSMELLATDGKMIDLILKQ